ncbi:MAG: hypothetical protein JO252_06935 [Planctomycetaceae bacterium]|nr:hypothetical protein [Planctomycetaceae bacterium]
MSRVRFRVPLGVQVGAVALLFAAALVTLWVNGVSAFRREHRRATSARMMTEASAQMTKQGVGALEAVPLWPNLLDAPEWDKLDRRLSAVTASVLARYDSVEGGYFVRDGKFLGYAFPTRPQKPAPKTKRGSYSRWGSDPPPLEYGLIEAQADAAIRKREPQFVVQHVAPSTVAVLTTPVWVRGRVVAATWTMTRLIDPLFLDRSLRGYRLAAGLAVSGIALALLLTLGLARTVRRQAEERERLQAELRRSERLAALGKLLAGVAHEVRNPLAGIRSTVQLWQRGIGFDDESFEGLLAEADRLEGIVARLLHFSRADAQDLAPGPLNEVVAEVARLTRGPAESQGVRVELDLAPGLPPVAMAPPALVQVFRNLTTNALQVMPEGGALRLATRLDPTGRRVEASVADTGPGLTPEVVGHLFEPFFTTKAGGTGLGLAIAREIALAHRGEIRAESRPGVPGAVFTLSLPVAETPNRGPHGRA